MSRFSIIYLLVLILVSAQTSLGYCGNSPVFPSMGLTDIQGMDVYAETDKLHVVLVGKAKDTHELGVYYLVSANSGTTWSKPVRVNAGSDRRLMSRRGNDAQVAAVGKRLVVAFRQAGDLPESGPVVMAYSMDGGKHWEEGENPAVGDLTQNQSYVDLIADRSGHFHVVWLDDREENGNSQGLRYARSVDGGKRWQGDLTLDGAVCTCCWNRLAVLPDQSVAALYRDDDPHDMRLVRRSIQDGSWHNLGAVGAFDWRFSGCPHCGGGIASSSGRHSRLHGVVWSGKEGLAGLHYLNSIDQGAHWTPPLQIADGQSKESDIAVLESGPVSVVYATPTGQGEAVLLTQSGDDGKHWTGPVALSAADGVADHPRIVATKKGFRVFWTEKRPAGGKVWAVYSLSTH